MFHTVYCVSFQLTEVGQYGVSGPTAQLHVERKPASVADPVVIPNPCTKVWSVRDQPYPPADVTILPAQVRYSYITPFYV